MILQRSLTGKAASRRSAIAIGNFDGIHRGHQALLGRLRQKSEADKLASTVILFEPQPAEFLRPDKAPPRIMGLGDKLALLRQLSIQHVLCLRFNYELSHMRARDFIRTVLCRELGASALFLGPDFRFGFRREGDLQLLRQEGAEQGFEVEVAPMLEHDNARISSTDIRRALAAGDLARASALLGHNVFMRGRVVSGAGRGRKLGVPTLNMEPKRCPVPSGIFSSKLHVGSAVHGGVSYIGFRPQYSDRAAPVLETHLFETPSQSYHGAWARVELLHMIREDRAFAGEPELVQQMRLDIAASKKWHQEHAS